MDKFVNIFNAILIFVYCFSEIFKRSHSLLPKGEHNIRSWLGIAERISVGSSASRQIASKGGHSLFTITTLSSSARLQIPRSRWEARFLRPCSFLCDANRLWNIKRNCECAECRVLIYEIFRFFYCDFRLWFPSNSRN